MQETIKGSCEHCGFAFEGKVTLVQGSFPTLNCPKCGKETENFDSADEVDERNKVEKYGLVYTPVNF